MFQKFLSLITIFALVGIGSITLIAMVTHAGCLAQTLQGGGCPANVGSISFFNFHMKAFEQLSLAIFLFIFMFLILVFISNISLFFPTIKFYKNLFVLNFISPSLIKAQAWLSLRELSPSYIS